MTRTTEHPRAHVHAETGRCRAVLSRLHGVKRAGQGWQALCPAHEDRNPSLSIADGDDRVLLYCHAGCALDAILQALGLAASDLCDQPTPTPPATGKRIVATYDYTDEAGTLRFQVLRYAPKDFRQRQPDGAGGWLYHMRGITPTLYRLPRVRQAIAQGELLLLVEGEKDVLALEALGFTATCNPMGAGKWRREYSETLRQAKVVILPDNDTPGQQHAEKVAASLAGLAAHVAILSLPGLPAKGDVSDWIAQGHARDELADLAAAAPAWLAEAHEAPHRFALTDLGNAERLIAVHGQNLRYHVDAGQWLHWNGARWMAGVTGEIHRLASLVVRGIAGEAEKLPVGEEREALYKHMLKSESAPRLAAIESLARYRPVIPVTTRDLDANPWLLNVGNGTLDLQRGVLRPQQRDDFITKSSAVGYDPMLPCPRWQQFLREVFCDDEELLHYLQRFAGYCLTGDTREQCLLFMVGKGANGKSVLLETLRALLGDYARDTSFATFLDRRDTATADLAGLVGARMVTASEGDGAAAFNEALLKRVTGNDAITCRYLYREFFSYTPTFKIVIATNEVPRLTSQGYAMRRRVHILPFARTFYAAGDGREPLRDEHLRDTLRAELPGILAWAVQGCLQWQRHGLNPPLRVREETQALFESFDPLADFLDNACVLHPSAQVESGALWRHYHAWCEEHGRQPAFRQPQGFSRNLCQRDGINALRRHDRRYLIGIGIQL